MNFMQSQPAPQFPSIPNPQTNKKSGPKLAKTLLLATSVTLLIAIATGGVLFAVKRNPSMIGLNPTTTTNPAQDDKFLVQEVAKLMLLPNETPTIATVADLAKTRGQKFFENAKQGDKVLIYEIAKKAILYRPSDKKIIEVGVVSKEQESQVSGATTELVPETAPDEMLAPQEPVEIEEFPPRQEE